MCLRPVPSGRNAAQFASAFSIIDSLEQIGRPAGPAGPSCEGIGLLPEQRIAKIRLPRERGIVLWTIGTAVPPE